MNLDEKQKNTVTGWLQEGLKLADIQKRLLAELGVTMTYMEVRLLVDDLKLLPKDIPRIEKTIPAATQPANMPPGVPPASLPGSSEPMPPGGSSALEEGTAVPEPGGAGKVQVAVDAIARSGTLVSGSVTFSDGQTGIWYLDQMGRLGIGPKQTGYKPSPADMQTFQQALEVELSRMGL